MTTLTALAKQEEVSQIPLTKVQARLAAIVGRAFRRPASLPPCHDVVQHEQPERRREITALALRIEVTDKLRQRRVAITRNLLQRIPELILETHACLVAR